MISGAFLSECTRSAFYFIGPSLSWKRSCSCARQNVLCPRDACSCACGIIDRRPGSCHRCDRGLEDARDTNIRNDSGSPMSQRPSSHAPGDRCMIREIEPSVGGCTQRPFLRP